MATIDSKKLLPAGKPSGAIVDSQKPFLVPIDNVFFKKDVNISQKLLKPIDEEKKSGGSLVVIKKKVLKISDIINSTYLIEQSENNRKRKERERQKAEEREKRLETKKPTKDNEKNLAKVSLPGGSILDTINRFIGFTLLGYLFDKYNQFLPKLAEFSKLITPVAQFIETFAKNAVNSVINFIDLGYRAYDSVNKMIKDVGGEGAAKQFEQFSTEFNKLLNGAIAAAMLIASTTPKSPRGAAGGLGASASGAMGGAVPKPTGGFGAGTGMTPGRYRMPGQAKVGSFALEQTRKGLSFEQSVAAQQASKQLATQGAKQSLKSLVAVPVIGSLIGFIIDTVVFREKPSRAAAGAIGSAIGQGIGIALAGSTTFGLGAGIGMFVGGFAGDWLGKTIYDALNGYKPAPTEARAQGGQVSNDRSGVSPTRRIKTGRSKPRKSYIPQKTQPGKDVGGKQKIEELYGKDEPGKRSALRALRKSSEDLKKMKSLNGIAGAMFGAGIDMSLGQKPDKKLATSLGNTFGSVIQAAVDAELDSSFNDISRTIAMANGGVVPSREIKGGMSIGEKIGKYISNAFSVALESSASKVLQNLNQEFNLEGGPPGSVPEGPDGGPLTQSQQEAFEKIRKIAEKVGSPNPSVTAAIAMLETGWLSNPNSVYFASGKTNPFGQTGRGPKGSVIGADGQEHAVYNSLEEGVKAHVDRWKSSYIGKTPEEIIESIRTGRGAGAPGMYNVSPSWTSKVLSTYKSGVYKQPSSGYKPTSPGNFNIIQYITGDPSQSSNYDLDGHGRPSNYHDHIAFATEADKERAKAALRAAGIIIGSELRPGDPGYHGRNLAIDIPGYQWGGTGAIGKREYNGSAKVRQVLGLGATAKPKPKPPSPPQQQRTEMLGGRSWTQHPITKNWTDQFGNRYSNGDFQNRLIQERKRTQASLAPSQQSREIASLQQSPSYALVENNTFLYQKEFVLT